MKIPEHSTPTISERYINGPRDMAQNIQTPNNPSTQGENDTPLAQGDNDTPQARGENVRRSRRVVRLPDKHNKINFHFSKGAWVSLWMKPRQGFNSQVGTVRYFNVCFTSLPSKHTSYHLAYEVHKMVLKHCL